MNRRDFLKYAAAAGLTAVAAREAVLQTSSQALARQADDITAFSGGSGDADSFASLIGGNIGASATYIRSDGSKASWASIHDDLTPRYVQWGIQSVGKTLDAYDRAVLVDLGAGSTENPVKIRDRGLGRGVVVVNPADENQRTAVSYVGLFINTPPAGATSFCNFNNGLGSIAWDQDNLRFLFGGSTWFESPINPQVGFDSLAPFGTGDMITATATGVAGTNDNTVVHGLHRHGVSLATLAQLADVAATESLGTATSFVRGDHRHAHGSGYLPDAHHVRLHALSDALDHSGAITDAQHGVRSLADAHAHGNLSGVTADQHHAQSHGAADHSGDVIPAANQDFGAFYSDIGQIAAPANPGAGVRRLYMDSTTGKLSVRTSGGSSVSLEEQGGGGGEANTIAFMVYSPKTKTNIGTAYVDVYNALEPDELFNTVNFANMADFRIIFIWDYVGAGTQQVRWVDRANNANVLWESATFTTDRDGTDSGWIVLPAWATGESQIEWQGKSTTATDDPIAKGFILLLR